METPGSSTGAMCAGLPGAIPTSVSSSLVRSSRPQVFQNWQKRFAANSSSLMVRGAAQDKDKSEIPKKKSLFTTITDALDFSQVRSNKDAELLEDARAATQAGDRMSREQYGALRRKVGGTYRDFFKDTIDVDGEYVEDGWVDKTCRICKKNTTGAARTLDRLGRYAHVECLNSTRKTKSFFARLLSK